MPTSDDPEIGWWYAYVPLLFLAVAAMIQPAGRQMGAPSVYSAYLRASPILRALDALVVVLRCAIYCALLRVSLTKAIRICCDRFDEEEREEEEEKIPSAKLTSTAVRLAVLAIGITGLVWLTMMPGGRDARWTAAWGWLFVGAYVPLEAVVKVRRWKRPTGASVSLELEGMGLMVKSDEDDEENDDEENNHHNNNNKNNNNYDRDDDDDQKSKHLDADRLRGFHKMLPIVYRVCFVLGGASQAALLYWTFLDLAQPGVNRHVLALDVSQMDKWDDVAKTNALLFYLSFVLWIIVTLLAFAVFVIIALVVGYLFFIAWLGVAAAVAMLPPAVRCGSNNDENKETSKFIPLVASIVPTILTWAATATPYLNACAALYTIEAGWVYGMLMVELLVALGFCIACFVPYIFIKTAVRRVRSWLDHRNRANDLAVPARHDFPWLDRLMRSVADDNSVGLLSLVVIGLGLSLTWYALRFAGSDHWLQNWRDALVVVAAANATNTTNVANVTNATDAAMEARMASKPIRLPIP